MGSYPSVVDWNNDGKKDLLVGDTDGNIQIYFNTGTDAEPSLAEGIIIKAGERAINVGDLATPVTDDWNGDGNKDLIIGNLEGQIVIYLNKGTDALPVFDSPYLLRIDDDIFDAGSRSSPRVFDWNRDGLKDLLVAEVYGHVYYLKNVGTQTSPLFKKSGKLFIGNGDPLRYPDTINAPRARLFIADWDGDGLYDILLGGRDGRVILHLAGREISDASTILVKRILAGANDSVDSLKEAWRAWLWRIRPAEKNDSQE